MQRTGTIAVLTGDLVASTEAGSAAVDDAMALLARAADHVGQWPGLAPTRFTRYRGDGWQATVIPSEKALRAAIHLTARLRSHKALPPTRIAIGLGTARSLGTADLADAQGAAFEAAGRGLDTMPRGLRLAAHGQGIGRLHAAIVDLLDERMTRWSPEQAEAMALAVDPGETTQAGMARRLGISDQAMSYRLKGAGADAIRRALEAWESAPVPPETGDG